MLDFSSLAFDFSKELFQCEHNCFSSKSHKHDLPVANQVVDLKDVLNKLESTQAVSNTTTKGEKPEVFYEHDNYTPSELLTDKPWKNDVKYFKTVHISSIALTKMAIHADSGGDIEVMGILLGKIVENGLVIMDTYSLPVLGTETRVNAQVESYEYMSSYLNHSKATGFRNENIIGWYHSHPGYGCWLSGIDVSTERLNQKFQDPYLAIVVDPKKTKTEGKVEIGAFRTFPEEAVNAIDKSTGKKVSSVIPPSKLKEFGTHAGDYYSLEIKIFKTEYDTNILNFLMKNFWVSELTTLVDEEDINNAFKKDNLLNIDGSITQKKYEELTERFNKNSSSFISHKSNININNNMVSSLYKKNSSTKKFSSPKQVKVNQLKFQVNDILVSSSFSSSRKAHKNLESINPVSNSDTFQTLQFGNTDNEDMVMEDMPTDDLDDDQEMSSLGSDTSADNSSTFSNDANEAVGGSTANFLSTSAIPSSTSVNNPRLLSSQNISNIMKKRYAYPQASTSATSSNLFQYSYSGRLQPRETNALISEDSPLSNILVVNLEDREDTMQKQVKRGNIEKVEQDLKEIKIQSDSILSQDLRSAMILSMQRNLLL